MIRIVIVDDEVLVRQGIKSYIENSGEDMEVAGIFSNAQDAIEFIRHNSVQVLITDIKMAQMDGIELIRHCVNCLYPMGIIVLSCHDNFEYAREVFALGADSYILKHEVSQQELIAEIKKTYIKFKTNQTKQEKQMFSQDPSLPIDLWEDGHYAIAKICFRGKYEQFVRVGSGADRKMILDVIKEICASNSLGQVIEQEYEIFLRLALDEDSSLLNKVNIAKNHLCTNLLNYFNERVFLAVSTVHSEQSHYSTAVKQAELAAYYAFYDTERTSFMFDCQKGQVNDAVAFYTQRIDLLSSDWRENLELNISSYMQRAKNSCLSPKKLKQNMQGFLYKLEDHLFQYYNIMLGQILPPDLPDTSILDDLDTCHIVKEYVLSVIDNAMLFVADMGAGDAVFSRIIEYIDSHYSTPITLSMLTEIFHVNQSYLCKLFRSKMQTSFVTYINEVRINHAKRLLVSSGLSVDEIAERTGFNNANYLVRVFKKTTGITTGEYRKKFKS